jgi:hypothetical protein
LLEQANCSLSSDELDRVFVGMASTALQERPIVGGGADRVYHFDLSKAVTGAAAVLAAFGKAVVDPTFVSWITVLASLGQLRGVATRISKPEIAMCVALRDAGALRRGELLARIYADKTETPTEADVDEALRNLEKLGVVEVDSDSVKLKQSVLIRM